MEVYKRLRLLMPVMVLALLIGGCCAPRPMNLSLARDAVAHYYEQGCFQKELSAVAERAKRVFRTPARDERMVVIFDIDETVLSEYCNMKSISFGYVPKFSHEWVLRACAPAFPEMLELYRYIREQGYRVIFITGRLHDEYEATHENLTREGFVEFDRLIVRTAEQKHLSAQEYKSHVRLGLRDEGYNIVACIGDQWSDITGPAVGHPIKIPNYIYIIR